MVFGSARIQQPDAARYKVEELEQRLHKQPDAPALKRQLRVARQMKKNSHYYEVAREFGRLVGVFAFFSGLEYRGYLLLRSKEQPQAAPTLLASAIILAAGSNNLLKALYAITLGGYRNSRRNALILFLLGISTIGAGVALNYLGEGAS